MREVSEQGLPPEMGEVARSDDGGAHASTSNLLRWNQPLLIWEQKAAPATEIKPLAHTQTFGHGEELGKLIHGDSLDMLRSLLHQGHRETVDLAYIDPPFGGGALYSRKVQLRGIDAKSTFNVPAYQDIWTDSDYLQFMYERLVILKELLSPVGSFYLHVDTSQVHYLKVICDEIFGRENFQREIIWRIGWVSGYKTQAKNWIRNHDTILFYTRDSDNFYFKKHFSPYAPGYKRRGGLKTQGKGHPIEDTWNCSEQDRLDSIQIKSFSGEKTGYPTQKNEALLERIIQSSCPEGGLVLDCFGGSGTTAYVARKMSRRWLTGDINSEAIHTTRARMLADGSGQLSSGFGIYSLEGKEQRTSPTADVAFKREGPQIEVTINDFSSPALAAAMKSKRKKHSEWRSIVDCVLIDLNYDGKVFRMDFADLPTKPEQVVRGTYTPRSSGRIAVMIVDLLGNEVLITEPQ
jgi:DNA modification methylase